MGSQGKGGKTLAQVFAGEPGPLNREQAEEDERLGRVLFGEDGAKGRPCTRTKCHSAATGTLAIDCHKGGPSDGQPEGRVLTIIHVCDRHAKEAVNEGPLACFENIGVAQSALSRVAERFGPSPGGWAMRVVVLPLGDPAVRRVEAALVAASEVVFQRVEAVH